MKCFRLLLTWKNCDTGGSTYQSLRTTLDKYSIFCGRNPVSNQFKQLEDTSLMPHPFIEKNSLVNLIEFLRDALLHFCDNYSRILKTCATPAQKMDTQLVRQNFLLL